MSLQPKGPKPEELVPIILWGALTLSMVLYLVVLMFLGKIQFIQLSGTERSLIENVALISNIILLCSLLVHQKKVHPQKDSQKQLPLRILTWVMNESVVLFAFAATFISTSGNGAVFLINLGTAFITNVFMFPRNSQ